MNRLHLVTIFLTIAYFSTSGIASERVRDCNRKNLPIKRESSCSSFFIEDDKLNNIYRNLISSINKDEAKILRSAQRNWIKRRDEICQELEEKSFEFYSRYNASRENETLDMCIIQLTSDRSIELEKIFSNSPHMQIDDFSKTTFRYETP